MEERKMGWPFSALGHQPLPQVGLAWALYSRVQLGVSSWTGQTSKKKSKTST